MKTLTIEHLSAYLPYGLKVSHGDSILPMTADSNDIGAKWISIGGILRINSLCRTQWKPLLRPLSQLTETIEHNGEMFVPSLRIDDMGYRVHPLTYESIGVFALPYWVVCELHHFHFDTFDLIESGLAEPIPSIPQ